MGQPGRQHRWRHRVAGRQDRLRRRQQQRPVPHIIVNNNNGTVGLINHLTGLETIIATGGARGDLVSPDTSNGTLLLSTSNTMYRLSCGPNCAIGSVGNVPEPTTVGLMALGLAGFLVQRRRGRVAADRG